MGEDHGRRSTDNVIMTMAGDIGYIKSKIETLVTATKDNTDDIAAIKSTKNTARGVLIGATILAGTTGSAIHSAVTKIIEHLSP